jgi:myo-inositol-hexaphosphate 3-phosphohydrolase
MKVISSIVISAILLLSYSVQLMATEVNSSVAVNQSNVTVTTDSDNGQAQSTTISLDRADLRQPHILRVQGSGHMNRIDVKINGKLVKSIANGSIELDLAPMMKIGSYQVEISGISDRSDDTISLTFTGANTNISQQSSGSGRIEQMLVINVQ